MSAIAYDLYEPDVLTSYMVFASPHSGRSYGQRFLQDTVLSEMAIRSSEDAFVDELYSDVTHFGVPFLTARAPRAFVDLNRAVDELDPALIDGVRAGGNSPRVASGLGVIPRVVANGRCIYRGKLPMHEVTTRLDTYWHPYHDKLQAILDRSKSMFGQAVLIDCHSMPREAVLGQIKTSGKRPDIVIGDRYGSSAPMYLVDAIDVMFQREGFRTARNTPFAGAYIAQHYGKPQIGQSAIQIEIDRSLYMDESRIEPNENFADVKRRLTRISEKIADLGRSAAIPVAAE